MRDYILRNEPCPITLAVDEVTRILRSSFQDDFFGMFRTWHNGRAVPPTPVWKKLDIVLLTSTEPYNFITDRNQSPFNVGEAVFMEYFSLTHIQQLNRRYGSPLELSASRPNPEKDLLDLLGGQPALTQQAFHLLSRRDVTPEQLLGDITTQLNIFAEHLNYLRYMIRSTYLKEAIQAVCKGRWPVNEHDSDRLMGLGVIVGSYQPQAPSFRCTLYEKTFSGL